MKHFIKAAFAVAVMAVSLNAQGAVNFTADPASGTTHETLSQIEIVTLLNDFVQSPDLLEGTDAIKTYKDGEAFGSVDISDGSVYWRSYRLTLTPAFTTSGTYTVEIPAGILLGLQGEGDTVPLNDETVILTYTITGSTGPVEPIEIKPTEITPEPGTEIDVTYEPMDNVGLQFDANVKLNGSPVAKFTDEMGTYSENVDIVDFSFATKGLFFALTTDAPLQTVSGKYTLTIPAEAFTDGTNYSEEIRIDYQIVVAGSGEVGEVTLESIQLVEGEDIVNLVDEIELPALENGAKILFNTSDNLKVGYLYMSIKDLNPLNPEDAQRNFESHALRTLPEKRGIYWTDEETPFLEVVGAYPLLKGHTYDVEYNVYDFETPPQSRTELASGKFTIIGTTEPYEYSDIQVENIEPEQGTIFHEVEDAVITISFDGPVKINETKSFYKVDNSTRDLTGTMTMSDDNKVATFQYPAALLEKAIGPVDIYLYVTDMEGHSLFFGYDMGDDSYLQLEFNCYLGTPDLTVVPASGELEEFDHIVVSYETSSGNQSIAWAYNIDAGPVVLTDLGSKAARVFGYIRNFEAYEEGEVSDGMGGTNEGVLSIIGYLENEAGERIKVTTPGNYVLTIPAASFNMGDQYAGFQCKQTYLTYTIVGDITDETVYDFLPVSNEVTFNAEKTIATVELNFSADVDTNPDAINEVELRDKEGNKLEAKIENLYDMEDYKMWSFIVEYAFEDNTEYTLVVPQGSFGDTEWASDATYAQYNRGHANPEFTVTIFSDNAGVNGIGADSASKVVYNLQGIKVGSVENIKALPAGIYIIDGVKVIRK